MTQISQSVWPDQARSINGWDESRAVWYVVAESPRYGSTGMRVWFIRRSARGLGGEIARAAPVRGHRVVATGRDADAVCSMFPRAGAALSALLHNLGAAIPYVGKGFGLIDCRH